MATKAKGKPEPAKRDTNTLTVQAKPSDTDAAIARPLLPPSHTSGRRYATAETEARAARRGLWALPEAQRVPPWEWRHGGKQPAQAGPADRIAPACGPKRYCREMVLCEEARHYLSACGLTRLDGDNDSVPCEALCQ